MTGTNLPSPQPKSAAFQGPCPAHTPTGQPHHPQPCREHRPWPLMPLGSRETDSLCKNLTPHSQSPLLSLHQTPSCPCLLPLALHRCSGPQNASIEAPTLGRAPPLRSSSLIPLCFGSRLLETLRPLSNVFSGLILAQELIPCIGSDRSHTHRTPEPQFTHL